MLDIPETVKALFKRDGVHKNFRVHFPNGEFSDITNEDVVRESVSFSESLCSQSVFRFGLAEASVLEFECVGIGNMYGMTIEAAYEIDVSSLTSAETSAIEAGSWDGELVNGYFRVPLGVFRVESCPRDHRNMAHRKVTAYTTYTGRVENNPFEAAKISMIQSGPYSSTPRRPTWDDESTWWPAIESTGQSGDYTPDAVKLIYAALGWTNPEMLSGLTKTAQTAWASFPEETQTVYLLVRDPGGVQPMSRTTIHATVTMKRIAFGSGGLPQDALYELAMNGATGVQAALTECRTSLDGLVSDGYITAAEVENAMDILGRALSANLPGGVFARDGGLPIFYPYWNVEGADFVVYVPTGCELSGELFKIGTVIGVPYELTLPALVTTTPTLSVFGGLPSQIQLRFPSTGTVQIGSKNSETYLGCYDFLSILTGYLEIHAAFAQVSRAGGCRIMRLDNTAPAAVVPGDYASCWWDEYDMEPIGSVIVTYQSEDADGFLEENTTEIRVGVGRSQYDMSNNELLRALAHASLSDVSALILSEFAPHASTVAFTPTDLTMRGWPWMEAGDALEITAEDATIVNTYALRIEISGIQHLTAGIVSEGGEIIEEA